MNINDFDLCMGCRSCANICTRNAISFHENNLGFIMPKVNDSCIDCSICVNRCIAQNVTEFNEVLETYACKNKDYLTENSSSSGGVFLQIAKYIIENNGIVYGCILRNLEAVHERADNLEQIAQMQGSKYIESELSIVYENIKYDLEKGLVLFVGTPCQVDAIKSYLSDSSYRNLITIDLVCHGLPSKTIFYKYCAELETKYKGKIIKYNFRKKSELYGNQNVYIEFDNGKKIFIPNSIDPYYLSFFSDKFLKKSCYTCKYASIHRIGDITIGDFWEHEKYCINLNKEKNVSLVMLNSKLGIQIFNEIKCKHFTNEKIISDISKSQSSLNKPLGIQKLNARVDNIKINDLCINDILKRYIFTTQKSYLIYRLKVLLYKFGILSLVKKFLIKHS